MNLKEKTVTSIKWNTVATIVTMVIGVLQVAILTRLIDKSAFGLIAIASMVIAFTDIFAELGITVALIHKQQISEDEYSSVYWLNIVLSIIVFGFTVLLAPVVATFYKEPSLIIIIRLLSLKILLNAFGKMFQTIKTKNLEFNFISKVRILTSIVGILTSTVLAYNGFGVMSLVYGQLAQIMINQSIYAIAGLKQTKIRFHFSFAEVKDVIRIGGYQLGAQVLDFVSARVDVFIIGRFFSMDTLGVYNIAKELIVKPFTLINSISSNVFSAAFAKIQNNGQLIVDVFSKIVRTISMVSTPIYAFLFIFADLVVAILYTPSFAEVAVFIRIMSLYGICSSIASPGGSLMIAMGRTDLGIQWTIVRIIMSVGVLLLTANIGIYAVAYGQTGLAIVLLFVYYYMVIYRMLKTIVLRQYLKMFGGIVVGMLIIASIFALINILVEVSILLQLVMGLFFGISIYLFLCKFYRNDLEELVSIALPKRQKQMKI